MSQILIKENEQVGFNSFDATENIVLVPLVTEDTSEVTHVTKLYSTLSEFNFDYPAIPNISTKNDYSWYFIKEILNAGLKVVVKPLKPAESSESVESSEFDIGVFVNKRIRDDNAFKEFGSKNLWNIKFITTGYWPNIDDNIESSETSEVDGIGCYSVLARLASDRGDCVALGEFRQELEVDDLVNFVKRTPDINTKYMATTYPAYFSSLPASGADDMYMPASFGYLMAFARSVRTNATWFAASGIIRGVIPNLISVKHDVTDSVMELLQDGTGMTSTDGAASSWKVNVIMRMGAYGIRLWGNRVTASGSNKSVEKLTFSDFLNVRMLLCDLKKQIYHAALRTTFEPNDDLTWVNFKSLCSRLLDQMQSGRGISWYSWRRVKTEYKATIKAVLTIKPIEAVEYFDITINLSDEEVAIEEEII